MRVKKIEPTNLNKEIDRIDEDVLIDGRDEAQVKYQNDGVDETVGEKPTIRSQPGFVSLQSMRTETAKRIDKDETKVVCRRNGLP